MASPREPIFLARQTYRRRRLIDAMRVVPVIGLVLFMAPLLGADDGRSTAAGVVFLFSVWLALIVAAAGLVRLLSRAPGGVASDPLEPEVRGGEPGEGESGGA